VKIIDPLPAKESGSIVSVYSSSKNYVKIILLRNAISRRDYPPSTISPRGINISRDILTWILVSGESSKAMPPFRPLSLALSNKLKKSQ
jgi:hypothetical protein